MNQEEWYEHVAVTIGKQAGGFWTFASLATKDFHALKEGSGGLSFNALVMPFNRKGEREEKPVWMEARIELTPADLYHITFTYMRGREKVIHFECDEIYFDQLQRLLIGLDYDGPETVNPRYWP